MTIENTKEQLENGCGFQDNSWKNSLCKKGNLCSECQNSLDYYNKGRKDKEKEMLDEFEKIIDEMENPYPKDVFLWNNDEKVVIPSQGRLNQFCFELWASWNKQLKQKIKSK